MRENFIDFPQLEKVIKSIQNLSNVSFPKYKKNSNVEEYVKKIETIILNEFDILPNILNLIKPKVFNFGIFRVREISTFSNINLFSEHSYPPINKVGLGRCNFPKFPVFYCSNNPFTAMVEVIRQSDYKNKKYCISKWEIIDSEEEFIFQPFLQTDLHSKNEFKLISEKEIDRLNEPFENKLNESQKAGFIEYLKYLHSSFIKAKDYSISATLAYRALFKFNISTDILMYPSVQTDRKGVNMAIHPNFVDNKMQIKRLYVVELDNYNRETDTFNITVLKYATVVNNNFNWKKLTLRDEDYKEYFKKDFRDMLKKDFEFNFVK